MVSENMEGKLPINPDKPKRRWGQGKNVMRPKNVVDSEADLDPYELARKDPRESIKDPYEKYHKKPLTEEEMLRGLPSEDDLVREAQADLPPREISLIEAEIEKVSAQIAQSIHMGQKRREANLKKRLASLEQEAAQSR